MNICCQLQQAGLFQKLCLGQMKIQLFTECNENQSEKKREENISGQVLLWQCDKKYNVHIDYSGMSVFLYPIKDSNKIA